jgi:hypothetical protein
MVFNILQSKLCIKVAQFQNGSFLNLCPKFHGTPSSIVVRQYATSRKFTGLRSEEVIEFYQFT